MAGWGGARSRSGPAPDPNSERSERRGIPAGLLRLPASGYKYRPKKFPLARYEVTRPVKDSDGSVMLVLDEEATAAWAKREQELWRQLWKLPQAVAWHMPQNRYLELTVALYCRQVRLCETSEAKSADRTTLQRYADTLGLTPQGLKLNGWLIVDDADVKPETTRKKPADNVIPFPDPRDEWEQLQ